MSFFLANVPQGTQVYHGAGNSKPVKGMEWLAFEPEHAMCFALKVEWPPALSTVRKDTSPKWWMQEHPIESQRPSDQAVLGRPPRPPPGDPPHIEAGWLHTYATKRDLKLLYIDGQSAAKSEKGTLDSQDYILLHGHNQSTSPFMDRERAINLCGIAHNEWGGKVDRFLRMEHGFEIILCDFENLENIRITRGKPQPLGAGGPRHQSVLSLFRAITARYNGIGGGRARLDYDNFVSMLAYEGLQLPRTGDGLRRLTNVSSDSAKLIFDDITSLVVDSNAPDYSSAIDWQAVADEIVERYARRLRYLVSGSLSTMKLLSAEIERIICPFIDYDARDLSAEIERCAMDFIQYSFDSEHPTSLAGRTIYTVSHQICSTLRLTMDALLYDNAIETINKLIENLDWTVLKYCDPGCRLDQVCFTAIWPFGDKEDHEHPTCRNGSEIMEHRRCWFQDGMYSHMIWGGSGLI